MSAKKTGGTAARKREKDSAMAAAMKAQGVKRTSARCPVCHKLVSLDGLFKHFGGGGCR